MKLKNKIKLKIKGLNQERAFNNLIKEVKILKLDRLDKSTAEIEISPKDNKKVKKFLKKANFEILDETKYGFAKFMQAIKSCYGVLIGLALVFCGYLAQIPFVWQIKIYGLESLTTQEVEDCISKSMLSHFKGAIDTRGIEIALKNNFAKISAASVAVIGQTLVVNIHESDLPDEMTATYQPIVSNYDCKITEIELIQGTLSVEIGQIVRKGQVLVQPYIIDSQGQTRMVKPMAHIKADVWFSSQIEHNSSYLQRTRTGKKVTQSEVFFMGLPIFTLNKNVNFKEYEVVESEQNLTKNLVLPLKLRKKTYYEMETTMVETNFEDVKNQIIEEAKQKALQNIFDYEIIKDENYKIKQAAGISIVTYVITVNREIGESNG